MYLVYVDESGDIGLQASPTQYFALSALVVHESQWRRLLDDVIQFRTNMRSFYGLKLREEMHAAHFFSKPGKLARIPKHERLQICKRAIDFQENLGYISLVNVVVKKQDKAHPFDVFEIAWNRLIQRIDNTIQYDNFPNGRGRGIDKAIIVPDQTDNKKLTSLVRKMRRYNPVPNLGAPGYRMLQTNLIVEDPYYKDSAGSFLHQLVDVNAYFLYQMHQPNAYIRSKKAHNYFKRYNNALCKVASRTDPYGIVYI
ncbi:DUF3800 domain-containing protein [Cohnella cellulosilytica]